MLTRDQLRCWIEAVIGEGAGYLDDLDQAAAHDSRALIDVADELDLGAAERRGRVRGVAVEGVGRPRARLKLKHRTELGEFVRR